MEALSAGVERLPTPGDDSSRSYCEVVRGGAQDDASKRRRKLLHQAANGGFVVPPQLSKTARKQTDTKLFGHVSKGNMAKLKSQHLGTRDTRAALHGLPFVRENKDLASLQGAELKKTTAQLFTGAGKTFSAGFGLGVLANTPANEVEPQSRANFGINTGGHLIIQNTTGTSNTYAPDPRQLLEENQRLTAEIVKLRTLERKDDISIYCAALGLPKQELRHAVGQ